MTTPDEIAARNQLRVEAQLPLLDVAAELARAETVRREREWCDWLAAHRTEYLERLAALPPAIGFFENWGKHAKVIGDLRAIYEADISK